MQPSSISPTFSSSQTETLSLLNTNSPFHSLVLHNVSFLKSETLKFVIIEYLIPRPVFITGKQFCFHPPPPGHLVMSGDIFGYHNLGDVSDTSIEWIETRDAAQRATVHSPDCKQSTQTVSFSGFI